MRISDFDEAIRRSANIEIEDALEADRHARIMDDIYIDADLLDPAACPPDRRFFSRDKEAWVYEHGNICELVFVRHEVE